MAQSGFLPQLGLVDRRQLMAMGARMVHDPQTLLFAQGDPVTRCYSVIEGVVGLSRGIGDTRRQITGFALPGDMLEIGAEKRHGLSAVAIGPVLVWEIDRGSFAQFVSRRPQLRDAVLSVVAAELTAAHARMFSLGRCAAEEKLAMFLVEWQGRLRRIGQATDPLPLPMSRRDIADYLGLTVETVCRTLAKLERRGLIEILPGRVRLLRSMPCDPG